MEYKLSTDDPHIGCALLVFLIALDLFLLWVGYKVAVWVITILMGAS